MTIYQWISAEFAPALSRMLLHSLWIGVIASLLAVIIIVSTKKTPASTRYNWLVLLLVVAVTVTVTIFFNQFRTIKQPDGGTASASIVTDVNKNAVIYNTPAVPFTFAKKNVLSEIISFLDSNSLLIVCFWFLIFFFHIVKMSLGLRYVHILKHRKVHEPDLQWINWLQQKSYELGIKKMIVFLESELIKIPTAVGHLKPVILIPLGLLSQLSPQEVESILVHELAHIKRRDYLVNLIQNFVQAIFFFNPGILWLSDLIRQEREKCCDDIAIQHCSRRDYLNALMSFQSLQHGNNYALALGGYKHSLLDRVKRIVSNENNKPGRAEVCLLLIAIMTMASCFIAFESKVDQKELSLKKILVEEPSHQLKSKNLEKPKDQVNLVLPSSKSQTVKAPMLMTRELAFDSNTIEHTIAQDLKTDGLNQEHSAISDAGGFPFKRYHDIKITPTSEKGFGYKLIEATDALGVHYEIEAFRSSIRRLAIDGKEIEKANYEYYRFIVDHIELNLGLSQKAMPAETRARFFKGAEIAFYYSNKKYQAMKEFHKMISTGTADTALFRRQIEQINQEGQEKVAEAFQN